MVQPRSTKAVRYRARLQPFYAILIMLEIAISDALVSRNLCDVITIVAVAYTAISNMAHWRNGVAGLHAGRLPWVRLPIVRGYG